MARPLRILEPNGTYHVISRATFGRHLFLGNDDRRAFEFRLGEVVGSYGWSCLAHCLLGTHYHLLMRTPLPNLDVGMKRLNGLHAQAFNQRHGQHGHLVKDRYYSALVDTDGHFFGLFRYLALNPVRAGLCRRPANWRWSSYGAAIGRRKPPPFLDVERVHALFAADAGIARERLRDLVEGPI